MKRIIKTVDKDTSAKALELVAEVFTESDSAQEAEAVRSLVEEIRSKKYHIPGLELIMTDENGLILGYCMFSRFHIEGKYEDELLLLSPVAVRTEFQRQHISKELIEYGFERAKEMGFKAVMVEGDPKNYVPRGFAPSYRFGVKAGEKLHLPHPDCLMLKELYEGSAEHMSGYVDYSFYECLTEGDKK